MAVTKAHKIIVKYTLLGAFRDWLFWAVMGLLAAAVGLSFFLGNTSLVEQGQTAVACAAAAGRLIAALGMILFICFHVQRAVESREIELLLSRPLSRPQFVFAYFSGFALLAASIAFATTCFISFTQLLSDSSAVNWLWLGAWGLSLYVEILTISTFALFIALLSRSAVFAAMSVLAFYVLARLIGFLMLMANNHVTLTSNPTLFKFSTVVINGVSVLLPRFDMLTQSDWLIYGVSDWQGVMWCLAAALLYVPFILSMTVFDMVRKQF